MAISQKDQNEGTQKDELAVPGHQDSRWQRGVSNEDLQNTKISFLYLHMFFTVLILTFSSHR